ncbi:hypothetical protein BDV35DRAFT_382445 [Aspergillus flavus]|uniref:Uncharacterized protein n=1 Tax=Aspergillus flavus TaxID=5059 RepID=A0A5N6GPJ1_ASPFL|nr:hypothetical protein BDV35DRAFT_382445 [Aspergillus flavus]
MWTRLTLDRIESAGNNSGSLKKLASSKITAFGLKQRLSNSLAFITVVTTMSVASVISLSTFSSNRRGSRPAGVEDPTGLRDLSRASSEASKAPTVWLSEELLHLPQVIARRRDSSKMLGSHKANTLLDDSISRVIRHRDLQVLQVLCDA